MYAVWTCSARLTDGRSRTLTVLDLYRREILALVADCSLTGVKVAAALYEVLARQPMAARSSSHEMALQLLVRHRHVT